MRSFDERKSEIFKRSEEKIKKIKKRNRIIYTIMPCFVFILCLPYFFMNMQQKNSEDLAPIEDSSVDFIENDIYVVSISVSSADNFFKKYDNEETIKQFTNLLIPNNTDDGNKDKHEVDDFVVENEDDFTKVESVTADSSEVSKVYDISLELNDKTVIDYKLVGDTIYNKTLDTVITNLTEGQLKNILELIDEK